MNLFKIAANQTKRSRLERKTVIKFLVAEKRKLCDIYKRMCDVCREYFSEKMFANGLNISEWKR